MGYIYKNITGNTAEILLNKYKLSRPPLKKISICNIHSSNSVLVDLYLYNTNESDVPDANNDWTVITTTNTYYIIKYVKILKGSTLILEEDDLLIDSKSIEYDLYVKLDQSDSAVDIIINN